MKPKKDYSHLPLKAYEVYENEDDWRGLTKEHSYGVFAGHTAGQARAQVAVERMSSGATNPWPYLRSRRVLGAAAELAIEKRADENKYWKATRRFARLSAAANEFNRLWPVGTIVEVPGTWVGWGDGLAKVATRTPAWVTCGLALLVSVEGITGGVDLDRVVPLIEPVAA